MAVRADGAQIPVPGNTRPSAWKDREAGGLSSATTTASVPPRKGAEYPSARPNDTHTIDRFWRANREGHDADIAPGPCDAQLPATALGPGGDLEGTEDGFSAPVAEDGVGGLKERAPLRRAWGPAPATHTIPS